MPVEGSLDDAQFRMRQDLGDGEIEGEHFDLSMNIDGQAVFVEFDDDRVMYSMTDMVQDAYELVHGDDDA